MSPEQAEGKTVDSRSDIFSFGSVLYEMATGRRAFQGATKAATLSAVLRAEPQPIAEISPDLPEDLQRVAARCLRKDPDRRTRHIDDVKLALEYGDFVACRQVPLDGSSAGRQVGPPAGSRSFAAWSPDGEWLYFSSDAGGTFHTWRQRFPDGRPEQITSGPTEEEGVAMAPDGRSFLTAVSLTQSSIWLHDARGERQISPEGRASFPKFTLDGKRLLYIVGTGTVGELRIVDLDSGRTESLLPGVRIGLGTAYDLSPDGLQVVFASVAASGRPRIWIAPLDRHSQPREIPNVEDHDASHCAPLRPGEAFARDADGAVPYRIEELAKIPGVRAISSADMAPGPGGDVYAFTKTTVQRNLYRIPVP